MFLKAGTITTSVTSLVSFGNVYPFHSSTSLRYAVSGTAITAPLVISAPSGFEISLNYAYGYTSIITLQAVNSTIPNTIIYARYSPSATGSSSGNITHVSTGSTTKNVSVSGTCIAWAIPVNYYSTVLNNRGAALKTVLYNKISGHTSVSYSNVWTSYNTTDKQLGGKIWDIYSTRLDSISPYEYTYATDQCGNYSVEGDCYNREHLFPQSWFNSSSPMVSDLHHLMASDGKVNGIRSNFPFGSVNSPTTTTLYGGKLGPSVTAGYTATVFEPHNEYKGDIARAFFYMATRYENLVSSWQNNGNANEVLAGNAYPVYDNWYVNLLISWHNQDPVSDKEIKRNNAIDAIQNNRNPFVDSPQLVRKIWGGSLPSEPTIQAANAVITNISNTSVNLRWVSGNGQRRIVLVRAVNAVSAMPVDTVHYLANSNLSLAPQLTAGTFIVYNGTGSSVTLTNMLAGTNYHYAIIEYNGWYNSTNYRTTGFLTINQTTTPVQWLSFDAALNNENVQLHWQTASERNNDFFEIEKSIDGVHFISLGKIKGKGQSSVVSNYYFLDENILSSALDLSAIYYRIKQVDFNGGYSYSEIRKVVFEDLNRTLVQFSVAPNPFEHSLTLTWDKPLESIITASLYAYTGEELFTTNIQTFAGKKSEVINDAHYLPAGIYMLQIKYENRIHWIKLIKTN
ncbi:MAG: endonuclease [Bacteroidia bacterium]|jgi:endonuclease I|nr:endonuclease [Bacteroidia bacterium]